MKKYKILPCVDDYRDFYDKKWLIDFLSLTDSINLCGLSELVDHFLGNWHGCARAFILPWVMIKAITDFCNKVKPDVFSEEELWKCYLKRPEFYSGLGKNTENCYVGLYCAYEDYFVNVSKLKLSKDQLRVTDKDFVKKIKGLVGEATVQKCWCDNSLALAREIRHCVVHNGGRPTQTLLRKQPQPHIDGDNILISPIELRNLHALLADRAILYTQAIKEKSI